MAFSLGLDSDAKLYETWNEALNSKGEIRISDESPPIKERVFEGKDVDLYSLPVVKHYSGDGSHTGFGRYITSGLAVARDPLSPETINMSFTRMQIIEQGQVRFRHGKQKPFLALRAIRNSKGRFAASFRGRRCPSSILPARSIVH